MTKSLTFSARRSGDDIYKEMMIWRVAWRNLLLPKPERNSVLWTNSFQDRVSFWAQTQGDKHVEGIMNLLSRNYVTQGTIIQFYWPHGIWKIVLVHCTSVRIWAIKTSVETILIINYRVLAHLGILGDRLHWKELIHTMNWFIFTIDEWNIMMHDTQCSSIVAALVFS